MNNVPKNRLNIIHDIFLGHHSIRSRISVFYADLTVIQYALALHGIPHQNMSIVQCRHALIHHILTGACFENPSHQGELSCWKKNEKCRDTAHFRAQKAVLGVI